ncbi:MAG: diacylglycerol kinase family protein [Patescibacteria group bacterium]|nr:diacylglycerol kinase family protein [Patescibacteria group bacterium]
MYLYLYDAALSNRPHQLVKVETRLTDLGISGKISRLSPLKNLSELIRDEVSNGVRTIVTVGSDRTLVSVIGEVIRFDQVALGHIPLGGEGKIADVLGLPLAEAACDIIAARRVVRLDVGLANNTHFLSSLTIPDSQVALEIDGQYQIKPNGGSYTVSVNNLISSRANETLQARSSPSDGLLEVVIESPRAALGMFRRTAAAPSILPCQRVKITSSQSVTVHTDGERVLKTPVTVSVLPSKLRLIVGKQRNF